MIEKVGWNLDNTYVQLPNLFYTKMDTVPVKNPKLVLANYELAKMLGLNYKMLESMEGILELSGNCKIDGSIPIAQAYAGHQFGHFTMLGDGRALLLGEHITPIKERFDIQLKGSGKTPYSRNGDGKAALGPMLREYIISEGMYGLNIPTTRSLSVISTGEGVIREKKLPGAILVRVAKSHIRVGTFQYASNFGTREDLKALADYTLKRHFVDFVDESNKYELLLDGIIKKQGSLIAKWQLVGFIHGVMNTDNMTVSGETIDYGPCAFMDVYNPETVFSSIDIYGRYSYKNQPEMAGWNLSRFAETLMPLLHEKKDKSIQIAQDAIEKFHKLYKINWINGMRSKLGIFNDEESDINLIEDLLNIMYKYKKDFTNTFIDLTYKNQEDIDLCKYKDFIVWYNDWQCRLKRQKEGKNLIHELMRKSNPVIIPRNHKVEEAINSAVEHNNYSFINKLLSVLKNPYYLLDEYKEYNTLPENTSCKYKTFCGT